MSSTSTQVTFSRDSHNSHPDDSSSVPQIVINTRPTERAAPLTHHLQAAGFTVVEIPMLVLQSRSTTDDDMTLMRAWLAGEYKALVVISPTAATLGLNAWRALVHNEHSDCSHSGEALKRLVSEQPETRQAEILYELLVAPSQIIAVGQATATVLNQATIEATSYQVLQPEVANNEGMLAMPEIESLQPGDKLLIWRGLGGRRLLVDTLQARGVHIDSIAWYERTMPIDARSQYQQYQQDFLAHNKEKNARSNQSKPIVVVSSGVAFEHWKHIIKGAQVETLVSKPDTYAVSHTEESVPLALSDFAYVVLGERLAKMVAAEHLSYWRVEDLAPDTILSAINATN
ncbi:uroporphyrinogen-III synthase [Psychrobacter sp. T6-6]|uniref:uroporphyrinogen-III synthase n=1 Tax=Psychrobacter sp. T6-6 TaxID=3457452 RepID=UPI003FD23C34